MKKQKYKDAIKSKVKETAFHYLLAIKNSHSKMKNVKYRNLELQNYLKSPLFDRKQAQMLLSLRTRTVRGIKTDFKGIYQDITLK